MHYTILELPLFIKKSSRSFVKNNKYRAAFNCLRALVVQSESHLDISREILNELVLEMTVPCLRRLFYGPAVKVVGIKYLGPSKVAFVTAKIVLVKLTGLSS